MSSTSSTAKLELTSQEERLVRALQILGDKTRYKIFKLLLARDEMCVSEIAEELQVTLSAVSQHFRNFEMAGLVYKERDGQKICYQLKPDDELVQQLIVLTTNETRGK